MSDDDKARLVKDLESDIGYADETFETDSIDNSNLEVDDESDLF